MIRFITRFLSSFFYTIFDRVQSAEREIAEERFNAALETAMESLRDAIENGEVDIPDPSRVISPFERHMSLFFNSKEVTNKTEVIESLGSSLNSLGEEIVSLVPEAKYSTQVQREVRDGREVVEGHIMLDIDNQSPLVYSIFMDLLKDGFIFMAESKSFVITAKILT